MIDLRWRKIHCATNMCVVVVVVFVCIEERKIIINEDRFHSQNISIFSLVITILFKMLDAIPPH